MSISVAIYVHGAANGGVEILVSQLFHYFRENDIFEINILTPTNKKKFVCDIPDSFIHEIIENRPSTITKTLNIIRPDLVYVPRSSSQTHLYFIEALRFTLKDIKYIAGEHIPPRIGKIMYQSKLQRDVVFTAADAIHVLSNDFVNSFPHWMRDKIEVIPNLIFVEHLQRESKFDLTKEPKLVSAGRLSFEKGFDVLIKSMAILTKTFPDLQLVIFGDGPDKVKLNTLTKVLGLEGNILFKPFCQDWHSDFDCNDIYVCASLWEGFGLSLAESVAKGVPTVCFEFSEGPLSFIENGLNGITVGGLPNEVNLSRAIEKLIKNNDLRNKLSANSLLTFDGDYNQNIFNKWAALFNQVSAMKDTVIKSTTGDVKNENSKIAEYCLIKSEVPFEINKPLIYKKRFVNKVINSPVLTSDVTIYRQYRRIRKVAKQYISRFL